jgi:class 3 adenylate cyclase
MQVRVGVNTGEVLMRSVSPGEHAEYVPAGHATSLAARMQLLAPTGSIAATEPVRKLCEGFKSHFLWWSWFCLVRIFSPGSRVGRPS